MFINLCYLDICLTRTIPVKIDTACFELKFTVLEQC